MRRVSGSHDFVHRCGLQPAISHIFMARTQRLHLASTEDRSARSGGRR